MTGPASPLDVPLDRLLGGRTAQRLARALDLHTAGELLEHFPRRWVERGELTPIAALPVGEQVTVVARVLSVQRRTMHTRRGFLVDVTVTDEDPQRPAVLSMAFFNSHDALRRLAAGRRAMFHGRTALYRGQLTLNNPDFTVLDDAPEDLAGSLGPVPVYRATGKLPSWTVRSCVQTVLEAVDLEAVPDPVPPELLEDGPGAPLPELAAAYRQIHRPQSVDEALRARRRFALQEALILQSALGLRRARTAAQPATAYPRAPSGLSDVEGLVDGLDARLTFTLTDGQRAAGDRIAADLGQHGRHGPMSRLLQGEVGSGKTLVALRAMLQVVDGGGQAALVAPTEVLATQHYRSVLDTLGPLAEGGTLAAPQGPSTSVVLLTGSMTARKRQSALLQIASGQAGIVVGTHALFSEAVQFAELGLAVVDEQHRFGVDQREALRAANPGIHLLVMSATPIPRSVAMTVFGDLDLTVLTGLPSGRQPVVTHVARMAHGPRIIGRVWELIAEQVRAGHQAFVVCPKIDPADSSEDPDASAAGSVQTELADRRHDAAVEQMMPRLRDLPVLEGVRIAGVHGRMAPAEQDAAMRGFAGGDLDVLVATTVVEVGVDVPNATVMAVLDADAFGLSTLHQLRGRVGRGEAPAVCLLATRLPDGHPALQRLEVLAGTQDGLEIARADLQQRGEGDVIGASQHGGSRLKVLQVLRHADLIDRTADWVRAELEPDGGLERHPALQEAVRRWEAGHQDAADYLERG